MIPTGAGGGLMLPSVTEVVSNLLISAPVGILIAVVTMRLSLGTFSITQERIAECLSRIERRQER